MKKINISVLGSTGSIGINTLAVISKKRNLFSVNTLSANANYIKICDQLSKFNPKNFIIVNKKTLKKVKKKFKYSKTNFYSSYKDIPISTKQNDITVAAIPGLNGLEPTIEFTKKSKKILLANKESIICGWNLLKNVAKKNKTEIIPIDSEHFSIKELLENYSDIEIEKIYITASGGPFLNIKKKMFKKIKPTQAIKHPKWSMGKKISVDSSTLMNKILELMEAQKIFPFKKNKYKIIIHPQSLVHAIISFKNGLTKFLYHEPNMQIPIANAIFNFKINIKDFVKSSKKTNNLKNLEFFEVDKTRFPVIKLLPIMDKYVSTPIIINAANEILIDQFLKKKISFNSISNYIFLVLKDKNYKKYAIYNSSKLKNIFMIDSWARKTTLNIVAKKEAR